MIWLDLASAATPVLLIVGLGLAFVIYYQTIAARPSQMVLNDNVLQQAFDGAAPAPTLVVAWAAWAHTIGTSGSAAIHDTVVIARDELVLEGDHVFREALKVRGGGLHVTGRALFEGAVVVEGDVTIAGDAVFKGGLLTHGAYIVHGRAQCGPWLRAAREASAQQVSAA